jgi:hypothetical protein
MSDDKENSNINGMDKIKTDVDNIMRNQWLIKSEVKPKVLDYCHDDQLANSGL